MTEDAIALCLAGRISPQVALARLVLAGIQAEAIQARLSVAAGPIANQMRRLLAGRQSQLRLLTEAASGLDHGAVGPDALRAFREGFDRAVAISPEASVAAYSLADPAILAAATDELIAWLVPSPLPLARGEGEECRPLPLEEDEEKSPLSLGEGWVRAAPAPKPDVLDLGCGIGRVTAALAPYARSILGLDIAPAMIAEARHRNLAPNVVYRTTSGTGLDLPPRSLDLILAVDSFPYLVQAATADRHVADAASILRPGGTLAICNLSYRGLDADRADACRWSAEHGFALISAGQQPFRIWDGAVFLMRRPGD